MSKLIYMRPTMNLIYETQGQDHIDDIISKGVVIEREESEPYLIIEDEIQEEKGDSEK